MSAVLSPGQIAKVTSSLIPPLTQSLSLSSYTRCFLFGSFMGISPEKIIPCYMPILDSQFYFEEECYLCD